MSTNIAQPLSTNFIDGIRNPDLPRYKEAVISELFGRFVGYLKSKGLTNEKEFAVTKKEILECSKNYLHLDRWHPTKNIVVYMNSVTMNIQYGVARKYKTKKPNKTIHLIRLDNLRYKISIGTQVELIDSDQELFDNLYNDFLAKFSELEAAVKAKKV